MNCVTFTKKNKVHENKDESFIDFTKVLCIDLFRVKLLYEASCFLLLKELSSQKNRSFKIIIKVLLNRYLKKKFFIKSKHVRLCIVSIQSYRGRYIEVSYVLYDTIRKPMRLEDHRGMLLSIGYDKTIDKE